MTTAAKAVSLTLLKTTVSAALTLIAEVVNISGPSMSAGTIDVTSQDSTDREFIGDTLVDGGEVTFDCNYVSGNAAQKELIVLLKSGAVKPHTITFNDSLGVAGTLIAFNGIITGVSVDAQLGSNYKLSVTIKVSSVPTITDAS